MPEKKTVEEKKFKVTIALKEVGAFTNFPEAFAFFFREIEKLIKKGTSLQVLETACHLHWESDFNLLTGEKGVTENHVLNFYDARDLSYHLGLMRDGKLVPVSVAP